ncbi:hypothetical protein NDU88_003891 [Pleurodeles waltl]|uniref:Uncharacterized protein n=1 Tax=Pleurodeles waltl TaxID=8319 RepID=A0AAV7PCF8_PLEWA|nr:hypothetical protein NDU88_003891 [Pleurodeles waltl]
MEDQREAMVLRLLLETEGEDLKGASAMDGLDRGRSLPACRTSEGMEVAVSACVLLHANRLKEGQMSDKVLGESCVAPVSEGEEKEWPRVAELTIVWDNIMEKCERADSGPWDVDVLAVVPIVNRHSARDMQLFELLHKLDPTCSSIFDAMQFLQDGAQLGLLVASLRVQWAAIQAFRGPWRNLTDEGH